LKGGNQKIYFLIWKQTMTQQNTKELINQYLKDIFYQVLSIQENHVSIAAKKRLSRTEMHSIEVIKDNASPILTHVAEALKISKATASVCIERLVRKGFVLKKKLISDRRKHSLELTDIGELCYTQHKEFHDKMVDSLLTDFKLDEYPELLRGLKNMSDFFKKY